MYRAMAILSVVVGVGVLSWAAPGPKQPVSMVQKLNQRVNFAAIDDPKITLNEALAELSKLYDVSFDINEKSFETDGIKEVGKTPVADTAPLPEMKNARLSRVLNKILRRVQAPSGATYYVRSDRIDIMTGMFQSAAIWGSYGGPHLPLVHLILEKSPFEDAIREIVEQTDFNIVVDGRAGDKAKMPVSARLLNTPMDTALRLLTDMADLRIVHIDNVLYVTTKENAAALEARLEKEKTPTNPLEDNGPESGGEFRPRKGAGPDHIIKADPAAA